MNPHDSIKPTETGGIVLRVPFWFVVLVSVLILLVSYAIFYLVGQAD